MGVVRKVVGALLATAVIAVVGYVALALVAAVFSAGSDPRPTATTVAGPY